MEPLNEIGFEIKVLSNLIKRSIGDQITKTGIEGMTGMQGLIIGYLVEHAETKDIYQRDLEREFNIRRSTVTGILQLMEQNELIRRDTVAHDARLKRLTLTDKALKVHEHISQAILEIEQNLRKGLSEQEIEQFFSIANKIKKNLSC